MRDVHWLHIIDYYDVLDSEGNVVMPRLRGADYAQVHGLSRGLSVLRALNSAEGGLATASELSKETKLQRLESRRLDCSG